MKPCPHCDGTCFECLSAVYVIYSAGHAIAWCRGCGALYQWDVDEKSSTHPRLDLRLPGLLQSNIIRRMLRVFPLKVQAP